MERKPVIIVWQIYPCVLLAILCFTPFVQGGYVVNALISQVSWTQICLNFSVMSLIPHSHTSGKWSSIHFLPAPYAHALALFAAR